jgi:hypothetical protein
MAYSTIFATNCTAMRAGQQFRSCENEPDNAVNYFNMSQAIPL